MRLQPLVYPVVALCLAALLSSAIAAPTQLFNGKDLQGWKLVGQSKAAWKIGKAALDPADPTKLTVTGPGNELVASEKVPNLVSEGSWGDCRLELEFMMAKNSNSGIKLMNIYEIQLLDSFGKAQVGDSDCGAVYKESAPRANACKRAGEWQTLVIDFRAPRFDAQGKKTENACFVKVVLNGIVVQEKFEIAHGTNVGRNAKEYPAGGVYVQGDHGAVAFRNVVITPWKF